jgi:beta-glucosidase
VLGNYNGIPSRIVTALQGIREKVGPNVNVVYEKASTFTKDTLLAYTDVASQYSFEGKPGVKAEYFNNKNLSGDPILTRTEATIEHDWQEGEIVVKDMKAYNFSARFTTDFTANNSGEVVFEVEGDDGYKFTVDGKEIINAWTRNRWGARNYRLKTEKGKAYRIVIEYYQAEGKASIKLRTGNFRKTDMKALAARLKDADAIIYVGGISPQLEGEEMPVNEPGFNGGDRTTILLPPVQTETMKALKSTGKPVIFVMMTGSAIAAPWEAQNVPAIVNAWYGGQSAGTAIADVLFGDYNPAGRLPVTFYKSDSDLVDFNDYSMNNRTYRYFKGTPLWGFGYGLSYTTFQYDQLNVPTSAKVNSTVPITVRVTNQGKMDGEEVVQLYISRKEEGFQTPARALKGFQRIALKAGESKTVTFQLRPQDLALIAEDGTAKHVAGTVTVSVGGSQADAATKASKKTVEGIFTLQ